MQFNKLQNDFFGSRPPYSKYTIGGVIKCSLTSI